MVAIKKGDFIELDYTGAVANDKRVFDTTKAAEAKSAGLNPGAQYKPVIICVGEGHLLPGLDAFLIGKELGRYTCPLDAEQAFGTKDAKLLKLIPAKKFKDAKLEPYPSLEVNIDSHYGVVRSVSGGRVTVDFNHPLAGRDVVYTLDAKRFVDKPEEKVGALLEMVGMHHHGVTMEGTNHVVIRTHSVVPHPLAESINAMITRLTGLTTVTYHVDAASHADEAAHGQ
jgi:FKBP-type peptidyl-prolyl cis-trans isomerase 2